MSFVQNRFWQIFDNSQIVLRPLGASDEPLRAPRLGDAALRNRGAISLHTFFIDIHTEARPRENINMAIGSWNWRA